MSQAGIINISDVILPSDVPITFLGNTGSGASAVDHEIHIVGSGGATVDTTGSIITITAGGGGSSVSQLTTDISGPVLPSSGSISVAGATNIFSDGSTANTLTLNLQGTNHALFVGKGSLLPSANIALGSTNQVLLGNTNADPSWGRVGNSALTNSSVTLSNGNNITVTGSPLSLGDTATIAVTGTTNHAILSGNATGSLSSLALGTNGQVLLGSTGADATFATLTSSDSSITFTPGAGTLSLQVSGGSSVGKTITGDTGGALSPTTGNWNILGGSSAAGSTPVSTSGSVSTLTVNVQKSQAIASTDATKIGLCNFSSAEFAVDANGFVTLAGGSLAIDSIKPNSGTDPIVPDANGLMSILGSGSITTVGSLNTETIELTGLTNHAVLVGAGTATITKVGPTATAGQILQSAGSSADPVFSTATYPSTTSASEILYSSSANVVAGITTANNGVLITSTLGVPSILANGTTGQVLTATTGSPPSWAPASGGGGIQWTLITADQTAAINNCYICDKGTVLTLTIPSVAPVGSVIGVMNINIAAGTKVLSANPGQLIMGTSLATANTGSFTSINLGDSLVMVCTVANQTWYCYSVVGNWTVA